MIDSLQRQRGGSKRLRPVNSQDVISKQTSLSGRILRSPGFLAGILRLPGGQALKLFGSPAFFSSCPRAPGIGFVGPCLSANLGIALRSDCMDAQADLELHCPHMADDN